ncbi:MAG: DUF4926 domain-containing protein [Oscillospiraceae bacterium]|nr:DUF4926 domain-containing protein [Oscillospiraceae bacterium]
MKLEMYQKVCLKNGIVGRVIEIFKSGEAYMIDIMQKDGEYEMKTVSPNDIKSIIVEIEKPFTASA